MQCVCYDTRKKSPHNALALWGDFYAAAHPVDAYRAESA